MAMRVLLLTLLTMELVVGAVLLKSRSGIAKSKFTFKPISPATAKQCQDLVDYGNKVGENDPCKHEALKDYSAKSNKTDQRAAATGADARNFECGARFPQYYDLDFPGFHIKGYRTPASRLDLLKAVDPSVTFDDKGWLDIGANMGGMLFGVANEVRYGVGVEYDAQLVNSGNKIARSYGADHISLFTFNLQTEPLPVIRDLLPENTCEGVGKDENCVDIASMYAVNMWIKNFEEVMVFARKTSRHLILELNWDSKIPGELQRYIDFVDKTCHSTKYVDLEEIKRTCKDCCDGDGCRRLLHCYKAKSEGGLA